MYANILLLFKNFNQNLDICYYEIIIKRYDK